MLTLEFKAELSLQQEETARSWLDKLRSIWNIGLMALEEWELFSGYWNSPCCSVGWEYRTHWLDKDGQIINRFSKADKASSEQIKAPFCPIVSDRTIPYIKRDCTEVKNVTTKPKSLNQSVVCTTSELTYIRGWKNSDGLVGYSCPLKIGDYERLIQSPNFLDKDGLGGLVADKRMKDRNHPLYHRINNPFDLIPSLLEVQYKYRAGTIKALATAWDEYKKSQYGKSKLLRGKPKYKRKGSDDLNTIIHVNPKECVIPIGDDHLKVPGFGKIQLRGLDRRWRNPDSSIPLVCTFKLCRRPSGWYVQLTGDKHKSLRTFTHRKGAIGLDPGLHNWEASDDGTIWENPRYFRRQQEKLVLKQQQLAHKLTHRLTLWLNHPDRTVDEIRRHCPSVSKANAVKLLTAKQEAEIVELIGKSALNHLKWRVVGLSKRELKLKEEIGKLHERCKMQRRNHAHKHSTWLARKYEVIVHEDGLQREHVRHRAQPIPNAAGTGFERSDAREKSELTKSLSDTGQGGFMTMLEQKTKQRGGHFERFPAKDTTRECPVCGHLEDMPFGARWFRCNRCKWECDADQKAAIIMLIKHFEAGKVAFEKLSKPVRDTYELRQNWQRKNSPPPSSLKRNNSGKSRKSNRARNR